MARIARAARRLEATRRETRGSVAHAAYGTRRRIHDGWRARRAAVGAARCPGRLPAYRATDAVRARRSRHRRGCWGGAPFRGRAYVPRDGPMVRGPVP